MKINLNLQEDERLRSEVKHLISGQVRKIIRDEIKEIVRKEFEQKEDSCWKEKRIKKIYEAEFAVLVRNEINKLALRDDFWKRTITHYAEGLVKRSISETDVNSIVKRITVDILTKIIKKSIEKNGEQE